MARARSFDSWLVERLKIPAEAAAYLEEHLKDDGEDDYEPLLLLALRNIARAHGMESVADRTSLNRETLYRTLSSRGNPRLRTLTGILSALGLEIHIRKKVAKKRQAKVARRKKLTA